MNYYNSFTKLISIAALLWSLPVTPASAEKIALIVAIGDYPANSGWSKTNAANDIDLIRSALISQGFLENMIFELRDADATRTGIEQAIQNRLLERAQPGDIVFFHFSGHGQQVQDDNNDELDGYDEAIVPFDSPLGYVQGSNEGQYLLRDDELGRLFNLIRQKIGKTGQLLVVLDSCHSGTGTRGMGTARGTDQKMADSTWIKSHAGSQSQRTETQFEEPQNDQNNTLVAFFGSAQEQLNYETTDLEGRMVGSLSYAFSKSFGRMQWNATYRDLFEQIRLEMAIVVPRQTPQAEGMLDRAVMGGNIVVQLPFFTVKHISQNGKALVEGGWLQGLNEGSVVGFYPSDARDTKSASPIAKARIVSSQPLRCTVQTDSAGVDAAQLSSARVFLLEQNPGDLHLNLRLQVTDGPFKSAMLGMLQRQTFVRLTEPAELVLIESGTELELLGAGEQSLARFSTNQGEEALAGGVMNEIRKAGQAKFLRNLDTPGSEISLTMEIIPVLVDGRKKETGRLDIANFIAPGGALCLPEGTRFKVKISNNGSQFAYFTLIDLQPDNVFTILIPDERKNYQTAAEFLLAPGASMETRGTFTVGQPYGQEIFKLIGTDRPVDLRSIKSTGGTLLRGGSEPATPLEQLFSDSFFTDAVQDRGWQTERVPAGSLGICTLNFLITPVK